MFNPIIPPSLSHYQTAYTLPLQSLCWAPDRAQHTAIGLAKAFLSTSFYMITFASPISRLLSDSTKMETDANWLEYSPASAIHVREPLPAGQDRIDILLDNLWSSSVDPPSLSFEDIIVSWFSDLLLGSNQATDDTGVDNQMFQAYRLFP